MILYCRIGFIGEIVAHLFQKIIVTKSRRKPWFDDKGIMHVGLYDFLLDESYLK